MQARVKIQKFCKGRASAQIFDDARNLGHWVESRIAKAKVNLTVCEGKKRRDQIPDIIFLSPTW